MPPFPDGLSGSAHEFGKQRMRPSGPGEELRMKLDANHERVAADLPGLNQIAIGGDAADYQSRVLQHLPVGVVQLETMPVALGDLMGLIGGHGPSVLLRKARIGAKPHGAAH